MTLKEAAKNFARMTGHSDDEQTFICGAEWMQDHPGWIEVKTKPPEKPNEYMVTDGIIIWTACFDGKYWHHTASGDITHYMPVPKLP